MTRRNLSDLVKLRMGVIGADTRMDERTIWWLADGVRKKLLGDYVKAFGADARGAFMKPIKVAVQNDSTLNLKYAQIEIVDLPDNAGITMVGKTQDDENPFIQTNVGQAAVYNGLEAADIGTSYWQEGDRLYFKNLGGEVEDVVVRCVPSISMLTDDEHIPMPSTIDDAVIEETVKKMFNQIPSDKTADARNSPE